MRLLTAALLAAVCPAHAWADGAADGPSDVVLEQVAPAIVEILTSGCAGPDSERAASGFVWADHGVVTDLHVVAGCAGVSVSFQDQGVFAAKVTHVLRPDDLVLLDVPGAPAVAGLIAADRAPIVGEHLDAFGYPLGIPRRDTMPLSVSFATQESPMLFQGLSPDVRAQIQAQGIPDLDTQVLHLVGGNLVPGHSGAPLIDWQGRVLGIGSGGLAGGSVGIGWAVRAQYLAALPGADDAMPSLGPVTGASFSYPVPAAPPVGVPGEPERRLPGAEATAPAPPSPAPPAPSPSAPAAPQWRTVGFAYAVPNRGGQDIVTCGSLTLYRTRTATFGELGSSSDDPDRIGALASDIGGVPLDQLAGRSVSIWTELQSGAAIVVPTDARIASGTPFCTVSTGDADIVMLVRFEPLPTETATVAWDLAKDRMARQSFKEIDGVTSSGISYRGEGLMAGPHLVNGAEVQRRLGEAHPRDGRQVRLYRADLAGRGAYGLVAAVARDLHQTPAAKLAWAESMLAVHLSLFPPKFGDARTQGLKPLARTYPRIQCGDDAISPLGDAGGGLTSWTDPGYGYRIALPSGASPKPVGNACVVATGNPAITYVIRTIDRAGEHVAKGPEWKARMAAETEAFPGTMARLAPGPQTVTAVLRAPFCCAGVLIGATASNHDATAFAAAKAVVGASRAALE